MRDPLTIIHGDALSSLRRMESESVQTCVTSPPYWGLRSYGTEPVIWGNHNGCEHEWEATAPRRSRSAGDSVSPIENGGRNYEAQGGNQCQCGAWRGELGLEPTPELFVQHIVEIFREVKRVLKKDGTCWINLGDSYASGKGSCFNPVGGDSSLEGHATLKAAGAYKLDRGNKSDLEKIGLKPKDLVGIPWLVAFALRADGWYLRSDIIWSKPNPMPESVTDRPTKAHEYIFLLSKSQKYYYDSEAIRENWTSGRDDMRENGLRVGLVYLEQKGATSNGDKPRRTDKQRGHSRRHAGFNDRWDLMEKAEQCANGRNKRSVWTVATSPFPDAHFATFPTELVTPCILAGAPIGGVVLDPFAGSGTTGKVSNRTR